MLFVIIALLFVGGWLLYPRHQAPVVVSGSVIALHTEDPLVTETRASLVYGLPSPERNRLLDAVHYFCGVDYKRDSCLHHLITCGMPCVTVVPRDRRMTVFQDYQKARVERGLLPLPPRTSED